jgi:DNA-binding CsgD family transcriptional regulator
MSMMKVSMSIRELEILRKSAEGLSAEQIARDLNENQQQIKDSQKRILMKTGTRNLFNALQTLARNGFVFTE